jgi:HEAT repeat protein
LLSQIPHFYTHFYIIGVILIKNYLFLRKDSKMHLSIVNSTIIITIILFSLFCSSVKELEGYKQNLRSDNIETRRDAAEKICGMGNRARSASYDLMEALTDKDPIVRRYAIEALGDLRPKMTIDYNNKFIWVINDPDLHVRRAAVVAAGKLETYPGSIITMLQKRLGDSDQLVRELSISTFERIGPFGLRALQRAIKDPDAEMRKIGALVLGRLGPIAGRVREDLVLLQQNDENNDVRTAAAKALETIPEGSVALSDQEQKTMEKMESSINKENEAAEKMLEGLLSEEKGAEDSNK